MNTCLVFRECFIYETIDPDIASCHPGEFMHE